MVVSELRGEKIDIIPWNNEPARFVAKALSPARVREVFVDDDSREATVIVPDDQLALAIGKEGLNARLAARLTGWKVDIQSDSEFAQAEAEAAYGGSDDADFTGRCSAILSNGKRCPNASLPGSRFCGVPAHQELANREARGESLEGLIVVPAAEAENEEPAEGESEDEQVASGEQPEGASDSPVLTEEPAVADAPAEEPEPVPVAASAPADEPEPAEAADGDQRVEQLVEEAEPTA
jgi:N utilization substance protein A